MPHDDDDAAYLWDMLDAARAVQIFIQGKTLEDYTSDRQLRGAVERHIEIIGEAARGVSKGFEAEHPNIPWQKIVAQRHILAHEYGRVNHKVIWRIATERIPELIAQLEPLVPPPPDETHDESAN